MNRREKKIEQGITIMVSLTPVLLVFNLPSVIWWCRSFDQPETGEMKPEELGESKPFLACGHTSFTSGSGGVSMPGKGTTQA